MVRIGKCQAPCQMLKQMPSQNEIGALPQRTTATIVQFRSVHCYLLQLLLLFPQIYYFTTCSCCYCYCYHDVQNSLLFRISLKLQLHQHIYVHLDQLL